jgi:HSP20 family molecular chaperone IbpA
MLFPSVFNDGFFNDFMDFPVAGSKDDGFGHFLTPNTMNGFMNTDVKDAGDHYEMDIDLPGFNKEDITAEVKDGYLTVSANKAENNDEKDNEGHYIKRERYTGSMSRSFYVGEDVTEKDISAKFNNGTLSIAVPKKDEKKPEVEDKHLVAIEG